MKRVNIYLDEDVIAWTSPNTIDNRSAYLSDLALRNQALLPTKPLPANVIAAVRDAARAAGIEDTSRDPRQIVHDLLNRDEERERWGVSQHDWDLIHFMPTDTVFALALEAHHGREF